MAQQHTNDHFQGNSNQSLDPPSNYNYGYNYYLQENVYNNMYYNNNYSTTTGHNFTPNTNLAYSSYTTYNNLTTPYISETTGQSASHNVQNEVHNTDQSTEQSNTQTILDPSQVPHFWDDCEYINYVKGADLCYMCDEEVWLL